MAIIKNPVPQISALPKFLASLLLVLTLLSLTAVVLSVFSLVKSTEQTTNQPSSDVAALENEDTARLTECTQDSECGTENYCDKGSCAPIPDVRSETFHSEHGDFDYTLSWNTDLIQLAQTSELLSSDNAPSFIISGGGKISVATGWIDSPGYSMATFINDMYYGGDRVWPTEQPTPTNAGTKNPVYSFIPEYNGSCFISYSVIKGLDEALVIRLEDCSDNDMRSNQAYGDLVDDVELVSTNERYQ